MRAAVVLTVPAALIVVAGGAVGGAAGVAVGGVLAAGLTALVWCDGDRIALSALRARPVSEIEYPQLYRIVREVSAAARLPVPRIYVSPAMQPNSFATGRSRRRTAVCCTEGLLRALTMDELRGVLGHELAHVRARDMTVSSLSAGLVGVVTLAVVVSWLPGPGARGDRDRAGDGGTFGALLMTLLGPLAALLLQLSVSRAREYRADLGAARLTGDPLALARALRKIEAGIVEMPLLFTGPLASASHLMIANPFRYDGLTRMFSTHPPTAERVYRLEALAGYPR